ncbi:hypothetical protein [Microvirga terrestris]|uniref:Cadherin domain-containing protein n=1 Tax=Microvirga terrestris TaxID=2791024 RepID=A0ABS0HSP9_9HYPH|nr:hypothetical protein [Microvirga terrestris]MBF9196500.1 hypothetical protein [Microvirga terrestris]
MSIVTHFGETRVNTTTSGRQEWSSVASLKDGGWIVTWESNVAGDTFQRIYQQRYDATGVAVGAEVRVSQSPFNKQSEVSTTGLSDGGWVVTWIGQDGNSDGIFQQRFNAYGLRVGHETRVNTTTDSLQAEPTITALVGGGWVVTWTSNTAGYGTAIHQQRYGANGFPIGTETMVDSWRYGAYRPSVTALADGGWIVTYRGQDPGSTGDEYIYQQRYDADGWTVDYPIQVNAVMENTWQTLPTVTALKDGGWVVTWTSRTGDESTTSVRQQRFATNGEKIGPEVQVNAIAASDQFDSSVTALPDGGWLITWASGPAVQDANRDIYQQRYAANGQKVGGENRVNTFTEGDQWLASVTTLADGGWVVSWGSSGQDGDSYGIYQQRYTADGQQVGPTTPTGLSLVGNPFTEGVSGGSQTAQVLVKAFATDQPFTFTLLDDADGRFALSSSGILTVKDGAKLDYEQARSHQILVAVKDTLGAEYRSWIRVDVGDVASETVTGSTNSDVIKGNMGKDTFKGGSGDDKFWGGLGNDILTGDTGKDIFVFDTKPNKKSNLDRITDFSVKDDAIWLDNKVFAKLGKAGSEAKPVQMKKDFFTIGSKAKDKNDYIVYDKTKGVLYYDADGSGKGKQVEIATVSKKLSLTYKDLFVI